MEIPPNLPAVGSFFGVLGLLAWLIIHLMRQNAGDRGGYQKAIAELRQQHAAELEEITARHDAQITDLRSQINILRAEIADLRTQIEDERRARHAAEDLAAHYRRIAGGDEPDEPRTQSP